MGRVYEIETPQGLARYPSVTTLIDEGTSSKGLMYWSANCVVEYIQDHLDDIRNGIITADDIDLERAKLYHQEKSQEALDIGSEVHNIIEQWIKEKLMGWELAVVPSSEEASNSLKAFFKWVDDVSFTPLASELTVYSHKHRYAGTLDCVARINGKVYVIDFKTSKAHYDTASYQISAYRKALCEMIKAGDISFPIPRGIGVLRLDKETGEPDWKDYSDKYTKHSKWFKLETQQYYLAKNRRSGTLILKEEE